MYSFVVLCFLALYYLHSVVECFNPELSQPARNYSMKEMLPKLFDRTAFPADGALPLLNRKVFKGRRISIREHPYVASIRRKVAHYSVGCILTKNVILTVAHPLNNVSIAELSVVVGENYADRGSMLLTVILIIVHKNFNPSTLEHDIALLRTFEDITYKGSAKSIPLIHSIESIRGHKAFVTGWGRCDRTGRELCLPRSTRYTPGEKLDPMLRTVSFKFEENNVYCKTYERNEVSLPPGMLCLGVAREENPVTPCLAVPGAPLVVAARLTGILSWGFGCGHAKDLPLIYTNMQYYQRRYWVHPYLQTRSLNRPFDQNYWDLRNYEEKFFNYIQPMHSDQ